MTPGASSDQMPPPSPAAPKSPLAPFFAEVARQVTPEYHGLAELLVNFRERPERSDLSKALFHAKKLAAALEEAQRQLAVARK